MSDQHNVLVTGANSDIGAKLCHYFLDNGDNVFAMVNSSSDSLEELSDRLSEIVKLDFSNSDNVENFINNRDELLSSIDIFVSLASVRKYVNYGSISSSDLISHFTINTVPTILLTQYLGNSMSKKGWGRIVIGSSIGVKFGGGVDTYCYSVTKYATELIPSISKQWSENNVLVNVVRIGVTDTEKFREIGEDKIEKRIKLVPMQRLAKAEEIAKSLYYFGSAENTYITGQILAVSGGD